MYPGVMTVSHLMMPGSADTEAGETILAGMINAAAASIPAITLIIAGNLIRMSPPVCRKIWGKYRHPNVNAASRHIGRPPPDFLPLFVDTTIRLLYTLIIVSYMSNRFTYDFEPAAV
jgi:hypothetical protein